MRILMVFAAIAFLAGGAFAAQPKYVLQKEEVYDAPIKTQIVQHVVVQGIPSEQNLRAALVARYRAALARRGFRYHNPATNIFIYIYGTKEQAKAEQAGWIGMIVKSYSDSSPSIEIDKYRLAALSAPPTTRLGLSEAQRKQVFRDIAAAEDRATNEAHSRIPDSQIMRQIDLQRKLESKYKRAIARKHHLTDDQMRQIMIEGVKMGWPS